MSSNLISATQTKNYLLDDPILDWLDIYGEQNNFKKDNKLFPVFIMDKGVEFEKYITNKILKYHKITSLDNMDFNDRYIKTLEYMKLGHKIIYQGGVLDDDNNMYGIPDLLVRSDYLNTLIKTPVVSTEQESIPSIFSDNWHYRVIDIKFSKLNLSSGGKYLLNSKMLIAYKGQLVIYNECLAKMQGYKPLEAYILGRKLPNNTCSLDQLGHINFNNDQDIVKKTFYAINWIKYINKYGPALKISHPSIKELYPNMSNKYDFPWHNVKIKIAKHINDITLLWRCGIKERDLCFNKSITRWDEINCCSDLNIPNKNANIINKIILVNKNNSIIMYPRKIKKWANIEIIKPSLLYFCCDFETVQQFDDNCESIIFMVGLISIYKVNGIIYTEYNTFIANKLIVDEEYRVVDEWISYIKSMCDRFNVNNPKIYHWSKAEPSIYNKVKNKYNNPFNWINLNFIDLLDIFINEPIAIKGAFTYNLKDISKSLAKNNLIKTIWKEDMDGSDAMIYALQWYQTKQPNNDIMNKIIEYNFVDCQVLYEILELLQSKC